MLATIGSLAYTIQVANYQPSDRLGSRNTVSFEVQETDAVFFQFGDQVTLTDPTLGTAFIGFVDSDAMSYLPGTQTRSHIVTCKGEEYLADKRYFTNPDNGNRFAGDYALDLVNDYLSAEGVTANAALRHDKDGIGLGQGILSGTVIANNALTLAPAGATVMYTENTQANFATGTLSGVVANGDSTLILASTPAIRFQATGEQGTSGSSSSVLSVKRAVWSGSFSMLTTDVLAYDMWISSSSPEIKASCYAVFSDGTDMTANGVDYESLLPAAATDLSSYAKDQWYARQILTGAGTTKTVTSLVLAYGGSSSGNYTAYFRNIRVLAFDGTLKQTLFNGTLNSNTTVSVAGYANVTADVVTAYTPSGSRVSPPISVSAATIARLSQVDSIALTPTGTACAIDASIDNGATWQNVPNHGSISSLLPGLSLTGNLYLRERLNITGSDPTVTPALQSVTLTVTPAYAATKSDIIRTRQTQANFNAGTLTNTIAPSAGGVTLNGVLENWDEVTSVAFYPEYAGFGTTFDISNNSIAYRDYSFSLSGASAGDGRVRFDFAGSWANFTLDIDLLIDTRMYGVVYRTTSWVDTDGTFAYAAMVATNEVRLERGSNSTNNAKTTIATTTAFTTSAGSWHRMRVIANGNNHQIFIDGVQYINYTDTIAPINTAGLIGGRIYNPLTSFCNWFGDNFGVVASLTGTWTDTTQNLNSLGTIGGSLIQWGATVPDTGLLDVQVTLNGGSTWTSCVNGGAIPGLVAGTSVTGVSMQTRANFTATEVGFPIVLSAITTLVMGAYSSSGTRISPTLPITAVGEIDTTAVSWQAVTPVGTALTVDTSLDTGTTWTNVQGSGDPVPGLILGGDDYTADMHTADLSNWTAAAYSGGSNSTWEWDTDNFLLAARDGTNAVYVLGMTTAVDSGGNLITSRSDNGGICLRYTDVGNHYRVVLHDDLSASSAQTITVYKRVAGTDTQLDQKSISFVRGTYHHLSWTIVGTTITSYWDGAVVSTVTDSSITTCTNSLALFNGNGTAWWHVVRSQQYGQSVTGAQTLAADTFTGRSTPGVTALTAYGTNSTSVTLPNASHLVTVTGAAGNGNNTTRIGTATGYGEIHSGFTSSSWPAGASITAPTDATAYGFHLDSTLLEGQSFASGGWGANIRLNVNVGSVTADLYVNIYKRSSGGAYTLIGTIPLPGVSIATTFLFLTFPATTFAGVNFATGDTLYFNVWANIKTNSTLSSTAKFQITFANSPTQGRVQNAQLNTPGYQPTGTATWNTASDGTSVWSTLFGAPLLNVGSGVGTMTSGATAVGMQLGTAVATDMTVAVDTQKTATGALGDYVGILARIVDANNWYRFTIGDNVARIRKSVAGVTTQLASVPFIATDNVFYTLKFNLSGNTLSVKAWLQGNTEPANWLVQVVDNDLAFGGWGVYGSPATSGNTLSFDNFSASVPKSVISRITMSATDPTQLVQLTDLTLALRSKDIGSGVFINATSYQYQNTVASTLDDLAKRSGYWWTIAARKLKFQDRPTVYAPWPLASIDLDLQANPTPVLTSYAPLYRNRHIITGAFDTIAVADEQKRGDGSTQSWTLSYPVFSTPTIEQDEVAQTVGVAGVDTGKSFYWTYGSPTISQDQSLTKLQSTDLLDIAYTGLVPYVAIANNTVQQAALALLEGGSGIIEAVESCNGLLRAAADQLAQARIDQYAVLAMDWEYTTLRAGLTSGMYQFVYVPEYGVNNQVFQITQVSPAVPGVLSDGTPFVTYDVKATSGPNVGHWSKLFIAAGGVA